MAEQYTYHVQRYSTATGWARVIGSQGNRSYALGWLHALESFYPRPACRCARADGKVIEVFDAAGPVKLP